MKFDFSSVRTHLQTLSAQRKSRQAWTIATLLPKQLVAISILPARHGERPVVMDSGAISFDQTLPDPEALTTFAQQLHASRQRWAWLLPRDEYRLSVIPAPQVPSPELPQSLRWQLAATLDFPVEAAVIDYMNIPTAAWQPERAPELYVMAASGETVDAVTALFRASRLDLQAIDIRETAQRNVASLLERDNELLVLVAFCDDDVRISFNWHHELYMDRLIAEPATHDDTHERLTAACERIQVQLQRSLDAVRQSYPFIQSARIVLAGAPEGFAGHLTRVVGDPVETLLPETLFNLSRTPHLRESRAFMQQFHALGVALRDREASL
jgi:hypothetical protein